MKRLRTGGGWPAIRYAWKLARRSGGLVRFLRALSTRNACKTCALGMGGQRGGMVDEQGRFPEVCKKSMQAMAADMRGRIEPEFFATYSLEQLRGFSPLQLEAMGRLVTPVVAEPGDTHYRPISWDDAIGVCVDAFARTQPDETFFYASGRSSNEAGFLLQLFARLHGTNNVNNCSYYCHQASGVGLHSALGTGTATVALEDIEQCDVFVLVGGNPASNHPRLMRSLMNLRRRGGEVIVVNPIRETGLVNFSVPSDVRSLLFGSSIASLYVQPHIGGDVPLLCGVAKHVLELRREHAAFVDGATTGFSAFREAVEGLSWDEIVRASGVDRVTIERFASRYASAERVIFGWTMGVTHHRNGVDNVRAIVNLALLRGMVGKPGAGLLPIRGHSNVQGIGSIGVTPALRQAVFERLESHFGVKLPTKKGLDTLSCMEAMDAGRLRAALCLGGNLFGANPDARWASGAMGKLDTVVYLSTTLNTGHVWGRGKRTLILPMRARDEESQATTQESMFNFVRLSDGGPSRFDGPRGEVETIAEIARRTLGDEGPVSWGELKDHESVRRAIGAIVPGYAPISEIDRTRREFQIEGRTFHAARFPTSDGKARFQVTALPGAPTIDSELRLMTIRSEGQFNTVVYEDEDIYRGQERRDVILLNAADVTQLGLEVDQPVTVRSRVGEMRGIRVRTWDIRAGNAAMYYPEANVLVPAEADPESRTPAFKSVAIELIAEPAAPLLQVGVPVRSDTRLSAPRRSLNAC